ncbi:hypothetical protein HY546_01980, partial [archaeon]|nr:hypothetical protein [archaeon]
MKSEKAGSWIKGKISELVLYIVVFLVLLEAVLFFLFPISDQLQEPSDIGWQLIPDRTGYYMKSEFRNLVKANDIGFHDIDHALAKSDGVYRIVILGDSVSAGLEVPMELGYPRLLERKLNLVCDGRYEMINLGTPVFDQTNEYLALKKYGLAFAPDLVLLEVTPITDIMDLQPASRGKFNPVPVENENGSVSVLPPRLDPLDPDVIEEQLKKYYIPRLYSV